MDSVINLIILVIYLLMLSRSIDLVLDYVIEDGVIDRVIEFFILDLVREIKGKCKEFGWGCMGLLWGWGIWFGDGLCLDRLEREGEFKG